MADGYHGLDPCVHCGFCLPACPTYLATGDENESPRGRIVLMRALERGEVSPADPDLRFHLDNCLGCRGCEPACPSGVAYGEGLSAARHTLHLLDGGTLLQRAFLALFADHHLWRPLFTAARWLRQTTLPRRLAGSGRVGFGLGMLAASSGLSAKGVKGNRVAPANLQGRDDAPTVAIFPGCVMDTLFPHVHAATRRTLAANGYRVVEVSGLQCCGALHEHAGDETQTRAMASQNVEALPDDVDYLAVDSAGCGALLKQYGQLLGNPTATTLAGRVRDVTELLADAGPRTGGPLALKVAYDAPCHLHHAQGVHRAPQAVFEAIPDLDVRLPSGYERCCGSAGLYSMERPALAREILQDKLAGILAEYPDIEAIVSGNPGCAMHIGAGLLAEGRNMPVVHPVELLDRSYREGGVYDDPVLT